MTKEEEALLVIAEINNALKRGTKHYRKSDNKLLQTPKEIIEALLLEGEIVFYPKENVNICNKKER